MGAVLSCCQDNDSDENDPLLAGQQNGYGDSSGEDHNAMQRQMKEHEERMLARDESLKEIVSNTNDKLIDISMINNSGIVIPGSDLKEFKRAAGDAHQDDETYLEGSDMEHNKSSDYTYVALDPKKDLSSEMKKQLRDLHRTIFEDLEEQLRIEASSSLVASLKK